MSDADTLTRQSMADGWSYAAMFPYQVPRSLDDLHGPTSGMVRVPGYISTAPDPVFNVDLRPTRWSLYSAVVRCGTPEDQAAFLDKDLLIDLWPDLNLPSHCRNLWVSRFPQLDKLPVRALVI